MSLLTELQSLNVDGIVNGRGSIRAAVQTPDVQALVSGGAAANALGGLGRNLQRVQGSFSSPEALLRPVVDAVTQVGGTFDFSLLPVGRYADAVREGATVVSRLVTNLSANPTDFGKVFGGSLGDALKLVQDKTAGFGGTLAQRAGNFAEVVRMVEQAPRDAQPLAELAVEVILPFPRASLIGLRDGVSGLLSATAQLSLPTDRTSGLVAALDAVASAAATADAARVNAALAQLCQVRDHTLGVVRDDLAFALEQINRLRVPQLLGALQSMTATIEAGRQSVIDFLNDFRVQIAASRESIENLDPARVREFLQQFPVQVEQRAREALERPIDEAVARTKEGVRELFRQLPVRELRAELSRFLHDAARALEAANLAGPANTVRGALQDIAGQLSSGALTAQVQQALQQVNATLTVALDGIIAPLETIANEVNHLADQAQGILDRVATGLADFQKAIDGVKTAIDNLGLEQVGQQVVESLSKLRETAEDLLKNVPLPEPLRPQVEQLISMLEGIDFEELLEPARKVAEELRVPPDVAATVEGGLAEAKRVIENLIPAQLIASIEEEVKAALDTVRGFNPASLLPDVSGFLNEAANAIERLDPRPIAEQIRGPFQSVLDLVDRAEPHLLLAPVIQAYDSVLGSLPAPSPIASATSMVNAIDSAGRVMGRAMVEPIRHLDPSSQSEVGDPSIPAPVEPTQSTDVRAGDAIRLLGYIPGKLRDALHALEAGPAGDVLARIDALCGGLARQLRQVQAALHEVQRRLDAAFDQLLLPVGPAQLRAQLAIQGNFSTAANLSVSLDLVAQAGPGALRSVLRESLEAVRATARDTASHAGGDFARSLEQAATALESSPLAHLTGSLDGFLAALDPEPIAAEMDALVGVILAKTPAVLTEVAADARAAVARLRAVVNALNPMAQAQKFLSVLEIIRDELDVLNPRRLADELAELHGVLRADIAAYDPMLLAEELAGVTRGIATQIRALNPQTLLGDLNFLQAAVDRIEAANPVTRLQGVGASLMAVGERLGEIDLDDLIESVNQLGPRLVDAFGETLDGIRNEIVALLQSLRFATGSASVSAQVSVG